MNGPHVLTARETEIVALYAACYTQAEIADRLGCAEKTVDSHFTNIRAKIEPRFTKLLIPYAYYHNLITPEQVINLHKK